jgi:hypothetical protein
MPGRPTLSNALKLRLRFRPLRRHRLWQLLVRYLALGKTVPASSLLRSNGCRPKTLSLIQPRRNRCVLRLYECIGIKRLSEGPEISAAIRGADFGWSSPLYPPPDNLAMLHGGLAKLMRMSMRNMW